MAISQFEQQIQARFADIVRRILGSPNQHTARRDEWRYGTNDSLSVIVRGEDAGVWHDHEQKRGGGIWDFFYVHGDMQRPEAEDWLAREFGIEREQQQKKTATYTYVDETGKTLFWVYRYGPKKSFTQAQPGPGKPGKPMHGVRYVPYHLNDLRQSGSPPPAKRPGGFMSAKARRTPTARRDWGVVATTCPGGAGKWRDEYNRHFAGADVVVLPHNDAAGRDHGAKVAACLVDVAASVRILKLGGLPEKGDISDWLDQGGTQSDFEALLEATPDYAPEGDAGDDDPITPEGQPEVKWAGDDPSPIEPRQWLLGTNFCRGFLSGLTGAGATGKTALRLLQLIGLALGRGDLTGEHVFRRTKVLLVCLEDDETELRRRISAACRYHQIDEAALKGWLAYWTPHGMHLVEAAGGFGAGVRAGELGAALRQIIKRLGIGLVTIDPFVKSHGVEENDNMAIDQAATLFLQVAHDSGCAADYVHHNRKGLALAGDPDNARGASALANASRLLKTLSKMTEKEAEALGVVEQERRLLVRLDDAKLNIAPPSAETMWFRLVGVDIGNDAPDYPNGDNVQTVERWHPPDPFAELPKTAIAEIFDQLRAGPEPGEFYLRDIRAKDDWAGTPICAVAGKTEGEATRILDAWIKNRVLIEDEYHSPKRRKPRHRIAVVEAKAREILGPLYREPEPS